MRWGALLLLVLAIALPRLKALDRLVTPDEPLWLNRSANFYSALSRGDWGGTFQKEHPGVTVMWAGTLGFIARFPQYLSSGLGQADPDTFHAYLRTVKEVTPLELLVAGRFVMILGHTLILLIGFLYASRLVGLFPALAGFLLIAFDPFHLALTRLLHVDGLLTNLTLLSLLALFNYLQDRRSLDLIVSAVAAGFGLLTKLPAVLLLPLAGLLIGYSLWKRAGIGPDRSPGRLFKPILRSGAGWGSIVALVFVLFWPAMWVRPLQTLTDVAALGQTQVAIEQGRQLFFNGMIVPTGGFDLGYWYFYPLTYLWRSTPIVLVGLALTGLGFWKRRPPFASAASRSLVWGLLLFVAAFVVMMSLSAKKYDRYLLPAYAPLDLLSGLGWASLALSLLESRTRLGLRAVGYAIPLAAVLMQAALALQAYPYYFTYYNPILGGSRAARQVMQIGWGEGLDQAAAYLNKKPGAEKIRAISSLTTGCFSYFFKGFDREIPYLDDPSVEQEDWQKFSESDYAVIYISQMQRDISPPILEYVSHLEPEHTVWINGLEYARIYKLP